MQNSFSLVHELNIKGKISKRKNGFIDNCQCVKMIHSHWPQYLAAGAASLVICAAFTYVAFGPSSQKAPKGQGRRKCGKGKIVGLTNEGNTCFINTSLQALASCPSLVQWVASLLAVNPNFNSEGSVCYHLFQTLQVINNQHPTIKIDPFSSKKLIQCIEKMGWNMMSEQQDAHEFFNVLFAAIEEEKDHHKSRLGISIDDAPSSRLNSISPFRGYLASQLNCLTCSYKVPVHYDAFECLSIPLPKVGLHGVFTTSTVEDLLEQFLAAEKVDEINCEECRNRNSIFIKELSLGKSPRCLCVHIQRSHWTDTGRLVKRQDLVKFQEEFNVSSFVYTNRLTENWKPIMYRLRGVVVHLGSVDSGHFITYRKSCDPDSVEWFYTSDTYIRSAKIDEVLNNSPYMLFYERSVES